MGRRSIVVAVLVCFGITFTGTVAAQDSARAPACSEPEYAQFDFWVGEWRISSDGGSSWNDAFVGLYTRRD
jgi:hypothetical protein